MFCALCLYFVYAVSNCQIVFREERRNLSLLVCFLIFRENEDSYTNWKFLIFNQNFLSQICWLFFLQ